MNPLLPLIGLCALLAGTALAQPANGDSAYTETVNGVSFTMVRVPGGTFTMGSDVDDYCSPPHPATVHDCYFGETEVTQALWKAVMGTNPSHFQGCDQCPVENIEWEDAWAFVQQLNRLLALDTLPAQPTRPGGIPMEPYSGFHSRGYRLPLEAEWEYAAGNGRQHTRFCWGEEEVPPRLVGNVSDLSLEREYDSLLIFEGYDDGVGMRTAPVKGYLPTAFGLYDMAGNVWEFCYDNYGRYPASSEAGFSGYCFELGHVVRGGGWRDNAMGCLVIYRRAHYLKNAETGLRLARSGR